jgi:hypothetical protein
MQGAKCTVTGEHFILHPHIIIFMCIYVGKPKGKRPFGRSGHKWDVSDICHNVFKNVLHLQEQKF